MSDDYSHYKKIELIIAVLQKKAYFNDANALETAMRVMNYFGYSDEIIDNALDTDDRFRTWRSSGRVGRRCS
jgi:hypothetical protein